MGRQGYAFFVMLVAVIEDGVMIPEQVIVVFSTRPVFSVTPCVVAVVSKYAPSSGLWSLVDPRNYPHFISLVYDDLPSHLRERPPATPASIPWLPPPLPHEPHTHMQCVCHKYVARAVLDTTCLLRVCRRALGHAITNAHSHKNTRILAFGIWHTRHRPALRKTRSMPQGREFLAVTTQL